MSVVRATPGARCGGGNGEYERLEGLPFCTDDPDENQDTPVTPSLSGTSNAKCVNCPHVLSDHFQMGECAVLDARTLTGFCKCPEASES